MSTSAGIWLERLPASAGKSASGRLPDLPSPDRVYVAETATAVGAVNCQWPSGLEMPCADSGTPVDPKMAPLSARPRTKLTGRMRRSRFMGILHAQCSCHVASLALRRSGSRRKQSTYQAREEERARLLVDLKPAPVLGDPGIGRGEGTGRQDKAHRPAAYPIR